MIKRKNKAASILKDCKVIAVDFDGCLCEVEYPKIGRPLIRNIKKLKKEIKKGTKVILWTCRGGEELDAAVKWCSNYGLTFDAINTNVKEVSDAFGGESRKVSADEYWDDRAVVVK